MRLAIEEYKCKYYSICRHKTNALPCTAGEVAERYCKIYQQFYRIEAGNQHGTATA